MQVVQPRPPEFGFALAREELGKQEQVTELVKQMRLRKA